MPIAKLIGVGSILSLQALKRHLLLVDEVHLILGVDATGDWDIRDKQAAEILTRTCDIENVVIVLCVCAERTFSNTNCSPMDRWKSVSQPTTHCDRSG